jgi:uncharacterized protein (TIGR02001 family)
MVDTESMGTRRRHFSRENPNPKTTFGGQAVPFRANPHTGQSLAFGGCYSARKPSRPFVDNISGDIVKKTLTSMAAATLLAIAATPASAQSVSYNVGVVSLYKFNGLDQNAAEPKNVRPALQGGVDFDAGNGLYLGNWNSTGKFGDNANSHIEIDIYAGYRGELTKDLTYDVGLVRFMYPGDKTWDVNEWYTRLGYGPFSVAFSRGFGDGFNKGMHRLSFGVKQPINEQISLEAGFGLRNKINSGGATDFYLAANYDLGEGLSLSGRVSGAQTSKAGDAGKTRLVLSIVKGF